MKLFYDNSAEILKASKRRGNYIALQNASMILLGLLTAYAAVHLSINVLLDISGDTTQTLAAIILICAVVSVIMFLAVGVYSSMDETKFEYIAIDSDEIYMVVKKSEDAMAFFQNGQNIRVDTKSFSVTPYDINQSFFCFITYNYCPKHDTEKWQQKMTKLNKTQIGAECVARLDVDFVIGPQRLTDKGRYTLFLDANGEKDIFDELREWIASIMKTDDSGNITMSKDALDNNPYGFQQIRIKLVRVARTIEYNLNII